MHRHTYKPVQNGHLWIWIIYPRISTENLWIWIWIWMNNFISTASLMITVRYGAVTSLNSTLSVEAMLWGTLICIVIDCQTLTDSDIDKFKSWASKSVLRRFWELTGRMIQLPHKNGVDDISKWRYCHPILVGHHCGKIAVTVWSHETACHLIDYSENSGIRSTEITIVSQM